MVIPTVHTTQQNVLIGLFPKMSVFIGHDADVNTSVPI